MQTQTHTPTRSSSPQGDSATKPARLTASGLTSNLRPPCQGGRNPDPIDLHVGAAIRARRRLIGMSQEKLADALGLTFQQVQKYERGGNRVSASKLYAIAAKLGCDIGALFPPVAIDVARAAFDDPMPVMAGTHGGLELAALFPRLTARQRKALLAVAASYLPDEAHHPDRAEGRTSTTGNGES